MANNGGFRFSRRQFVQLLRRCGDDDPQWLEVVDGMAEAVAQDWQVQRYADSRGLGLVLAGMSITQCPLVILVSDCASRRHAPPSNVLAGYTTEHFGL